VTRPTGFFATLLLLTQSAQPAAGALSSEGKFKCRDQDPSCQEWYARGECSSNYAFMADSCPRACGMCEEAGFLPTPSPFQLDFVCKDQLAIAPKTFKSNIAEGMPEECAFRCRDNMTAVCATAAAQGMCKKEAATMRFQCPEACGVCKGIGLKGGAYSKHACRLESGDDPAHSQCESWAASGECIANFGFMRIACEKSCGLCAVPDAGGATPRQYMDILRPPPPPRTPKAKKGKGKKKKSSKAAETGAERAAEPAAEPVVVEETAAAPKAASEAAKTAEPTEAKPTEAKPAAAKSTSSEVAAPETAPEGGKKKGWYKKAKDAVGSAFKGKPKDAAKDEV